MSRYGLHSSHSCPEEPGGKKLSQKNSKEGASWAWGKEVL